jgi:periplasmic protein CpxP/Spy
VPRTNCAHRVPLNLRRASLVAAGMLLLCFVSQVIAQEPPPGRPAPTHHARVRTTLDDRVKVFAKQLDLNDQQQAAVKRILEQRQRDTLRIRQDSLLSGEERIARFRALQDQTVERIRAVLTEEQKKKYDPLAVRRIEPSPDQRSVDDWLKATTPK